jgi:IS30 family transposase
VARRRRWYSAEERQELWERWRRGESVSEIGRALDRWPGTVHAQLRQRGGLPPPERRRSRLALTLAEREEISRGVAAGASARAIACRLARAPSTVTRELNRHGGRGGYRAAEAERRAWERGRRPQRCKLARQPRLAALVAAKLAADWSPEQIAGWLRAHYPEDETMRVSHETIYLTLFVQARGALKRELLEHLRRAGSLRRPRSARSGNRGQGQILGAVSIRECPAEAADRAVPGHWEGDLLAGGSNSQIATRIAAWRWPSTPSSPFATDVKVYFCDPRSPWQRGSNENTNASCASTCRNGPTSTWSARPGSTRSQPS